MMGKFLISSAIFVFCSAQICLAADNQNIDELSVDSSGEIVALDIGGNQCVEWVEDERGWELGENIKSNGAKFWVSVGDAPVQAPAGSANFINSRENAYQTAFLKSKSNLVEYRSLSIAREVAAGEGSPENPTPSAGKDNSSQAVAPKKASVNDTFDKILQIVNSELDSELKKRNIGSGESGDRKTTAVKKAVDKILNEGKFADITRTAAKSQLKGFRRIFVFESAKKGKQAEICVVGLASKKTEQMADAMLSGDYDLAPQGRKSRPIKQQLPNAKSAKGLIQLLTSYGVEMRRDEKGQFWLVAYAQAGAASATANSRNQALNFAKTRAQGNIRTFMSEQNSVTKFAKAAESWKEFENNMAEYNYDNETRQKYVSISKNMTLSGLKTLLRWGAKHPTTKQPVYGVVVGWSPDSARQGEAWGKTMNSTPSKKGKTISKGSKDGAKFSTEKLKSDGGLNSGTSGGSSDDDF